MNGGNSKHAYKSKVSARVVGYFLIVGLVPLVIVSIVLIGGARDQMLRSAVTKQQESAANAARQVDRYLDDNLRQLAIAARFALLDPEHMSQSLQTLMAETPALQKIEILTKDGMKRTAVLEGETLQFATSQIASDDKTFDLLGRKPSMLAFARDSSGMPQFTFTIPILRDSDIVGAIIGRFKVSEDWQRVLPTRQDSDAYAYVVDSKGRLVYHPDSNFLSVHTDLSKVAAVRNFLINDPKTEQSVSETQHDVLSTAHGTRAGWAVVVEEPLGSVYAEMNSYVQVATGLSASAIAVTALVGLVFSRRITKPIKRLAAGARKLAENAFTQPIDIKSKDELQEIGDILNGLGGNISNYVTSIQANNRDLTFEQSRLRSIINSVNDGVIAVNARGGIISVNASAMRLVGQVRHAVQGELIDNIFPWTQDGKPLSLDFVTPGFHAYNDIVLAKGESVAYLDLMVEVTDRNGSDVAAIITIHDQTASRELNFMKLDFVAVAAHELRTPLTVIAGYLDILNHEAIHDLSIENLESLQKAIVGTQQLRELINKLLNIARIERGDMEIFLEKLNLTQLVATNVEQHQSIAAQKNQVLSYTSSTDGTAYALADTASIVEVLNNLIGNAIKYTPAGGQIRVNIIAGSEEIEVEVTDNGPGIPEELRDKLFSKFYRAERSMIAGTRGTGLGLFISKTIIELQHGKIGIRPDQGRGSTFYFKLPVYQAETDDELITQNISRGKHGWYKKRPTDRG